MATSTSLVILGPFLARFLSYVRPTRTCCSLLGLRAYCMLIGRTFYLHFNLAQSRAVPNSRKFLSPGHTDVARLLLDRGADPNMARADNGAVALVYASKKGAVAVVRLLLERGADPSKAQTDDANHQSLTPLMWAAHQGNVAVAGLLSTYGADLSASSSAPGGGTNTTAVAYAAGATREFLELIVGWSAFKIGLATRDVAAMRSALELGRADPTVR